MTVSQSSWKLFVIINKDDQPFKKKKNIKNCDTAQRVKDQKEGKGQGEIMRGQGKTASKKKTISEAVGKVIDSTLCLQNVTHTRTDVFVYTECLFCMLSCRESGMQMRMSEPSCTAEC